MPTCKAENANKKYNSKKMELMKKLLLYWVEIGNKEREPTLNMLFYTSKHVYNSNSCQKKENLKYCQNKNLKFYILHKKWAMIQSRHFIPHVIFNPHNVEGKIFLSNKYIYAFVKHQGFHFYSPHIMIYR